MGKGNAAMSDGACERGNDYAIIPFAKEHVATFTAWFNALPGNRVWTEVAVRRKTIEDPAYDTELVHSAGSGRPGRVHAR